MIGQKRCLTELYRRVYQRPRLVFALRIAGAVAVILVALAFLYAELLLLLFGDYVGAALLLVYSGVPFLAVSLMRVTIDCKRPYEVFDMPELVKIKAQRKSGRSFPSRHVFSAFLIGTLWCIYSVPLGIACMILGAYIAVERVALGIHFPKDVIAGGAIGVLSGLIGALIW
jgi:membrane-associated phospholipid phosphatase